MSALASALNQVVSKLQTAPGCRTVRVLETHEFSDEQFAFKVRAEFAAGNLQVRVYQNAAHTDYAYQWFRDELPVLRWDNKEHFPAIHTHPHHFHSATGVVAESPLIGDPARDLPVVLNYLVVLFTE